MGQPDSQQLKIRRSCNTQALNPATRHVVLTATSLRCHSGVFIRYFGLVYADPCQRGGVGSRLVFVDGNAIFKAQVKVFAARPDAGSPDAAQKSAKEFSDKLNAGIAPYKDAGYIVLNSAVAMNIPEGLDITRQVARQVGVDIQ